MDSKLIAKATKVRTVFIVVLGLALGLCCVYYPETIVGWFDSIRTFVLGI